MVEHAVDDVYNCRTGSIDADTCHCHATRCLVTTYVTGEYVAYVYAVDLVDGLDLVVLVTVEVCLVIAHAELGLATSLDAVYVNLAEESEFLVVT